MPMKQQCVHSPRTDQKNVTNQSEDKAKTLYAIFEIENHRKAKGWNE